MSLGDSFPQSIKTASAVRNVAPGIVIKLNAILDDGNEIEKRFLIIHVDENTITCVINSEISRFIENRPPLLKCQVLMPVSQHKFMSWDSYVDCSKIKSFQTHEVVAELSSQPKWILGPITKELRDEVLAAIKFSPVIALIDVGVYSASLSAIVYE